MTRLSWTGQLFLCLSIRCYVHTLSDKPEAVCLTINSFNTVTFTDEFREITCAHLIIDLIKDDGVNVENEDVVFEAVLGWVLYDVDNRKSSWETIAGHVRTTHAVLFAQLLSAH